MYQPSTPPPVTPHSGRTALIYGILAGLGLGIIESGIIVYFARHMYYSSFNLLSIPFSLLLWIVVLLVLGALAGKRTSKINTGTLAGLWAGISGGIITTVTMFTMIMASISYYSYYSGVVASYLTGLILLLLAIMGVATGLGALGGLIGQSFATHTIPTTYHPRQSESALSSRQSDPPQEEMYQYQRSNTSQREQQAE